VKFNSEEIESYCKSYSLKDTSLLQELTKTTWNSEDIPQMLSGSLVGGLLQTLIRISGAVNVLEIGMFTGYSALKMAEVLPQNGTLDTCELMDKHIKTATEWFKKSKNGFKITIHKGPAIQSLEKMKRFSFDMVFIDADKVNYPKYHKIALKLLKIGGIGVLDNMLWSGKVIDPLDKESIALRETAELIINNDRLSPLLLPVRDGVMIYHKMR
jgi:caffeoyl-CoA O-methyltransferase|tara:strand:- start:47 stop:685 length:639 start_codon:yes stop_codon:yes gene_type:complete